MFESQPYVSEKVPIEVLEAQFEEHQFYCAFEVLKSGFSQVRKIRGDGNCFYRAFLFQLFEYFICGGLEAQPYYYEFVRKVEASKADLVNNLGYDASAIEDFYSTFLAETKTLAQISPAKCQQHLFSLLCNDKEAVYMLMYLRYLTAAHLKKNEIEFAGFVGGDVYAFCDREVE